MKAALLLQCILAVSAVSAKDGITVLTSGTFHFDFPNLDRVQYDADE